MKKKISLCIISILFSSAIYAGPIQERLEAAYKISAQQLQKVRDMNYMSQLSQYEQAYEKAADEATKNKIEEETMQYAKNIGTQRSHLLYRTVILDTLLQCLKIQTSKNPDTAEQIIANKCLDEIIAEIREESPFINEDGDKIFEEELEKIRKKDLRQSLFWWLW